MKRMPVVLLLASLNLLAASEERPNPVPPPKGEAGVELPKAPETTADATPAETKPLDVKPVSKPVETKAAEPVGWERYKILSQRNMFSKERGRPREDIRRESRREAPPPPPRIESDLVLIGVVQKDGKPGAIIENRATGKIVTIKPGEGIGAGVAKTISLDSIDFECDGILHVIKIGSTLAGTVPKAPSTATMSAPVETVRNDGAPASTALPAPVTAPAATPPASTGGESVLERMRRKRQEELRK